MSATAPEDDAARAFRIERLLWESYELICVSIESEYSRRHLRPGDWPEIIGRCMDEAQIVVMTYFPPELKRTMFWIPLLGQVARTYSRVNMSVYWQLADMAASRRVPVMVADLANRLTYLASESILPNPVFIGWYLGPARVEVSRVERYIPTATDARRMFTAAAIRRELRRYPSGTRLLYVAAPAHVNRVKRYLTEPLSRLDRWRFRLYRRSLADLDKRLRRYEYRDGRWSPTGYERLG